MTGKHTFFTLIYLSKSIVNNKKKFFLKDWNLNVQNTIFSIFIP